MTFRRVGVVMGGSSGERNVSLASGKAVVDGLSEKGFDVVPIDLEDRKDWASALKGARVDAVFLALHGRLGEDGCVQGLCEVLGIPYTGSGVLASALAMDKLKAKELFHQHNVPTPAYYTLSVYDDLSDIEQIHGSFGFPVIVKPRSEGSSLGVRCAESLPELVYAVTEAHKLDDHVLVERRIFGREVNVGVLHGRVLGAIEIAPKKGIYDYEAKYTPGMSEYFMPARLPATRYLGVLKVAEKAVKALGCTGACRVDLIVTEHANEVVLEVNTIPGMTKTSLLPKIAAAAGYSFADLCESIMLSARLHARNQTQTPPESQRLPATGTHTETLAKAV
ncbi:MAG TPA: D-alanine--D-alanine ligase [Polyangiaceae bacterium]|jgi:D-alanine-D-alanine ligase|nr:MAG: D-alanine--D-alanine ligase B [Deltaproteobacteria bacterium ADurb.Bin207]HNS98857.1 D-alanine--D-alanine ligase [Polyangiaceae bacterium]HNZ23721.1 D-alanine--D-alanine ligase [Polyangiaceae bacterium]HOD24871.1 D-alanine--D-alanine ligase [Polyangiaceae bacterium]HOE48946.1 D-alanine--D-alanine ligase [Polyangiaceae bacterium]